jgi:hypothetical protein
MDGSDVVVLQLQNLQVGEGGDADGDVLDEVAL